MEKKGGEGQYNVRVWLQCAYFPLGKIEEYRSIFSKKLGQKNSQLCQAQDVEKLPDEN